MRDDKGPNRSSVGAGTGIGTSGGDAGRADRSRDWCHKGKGRKGTPDSRVHSVLPPVTEGRVGVGNLVAAAPPGEGEAGSTYMLTPERFGMVAVAL